MSTLLTLLHNDQVEHRQVGGHDAAAHRLAATLSIAAAVAAETLVARLHEQRHAAVCQHSLLHAKALLVLTALDLEDVPLVLLRNAQPISLGHHYAIATVDGWCKDQGIYQPRTGRLDHARVCYSMELVTSTATQKHPIIPC